MHRTSALIGAVAAAAIATITIASPPRIVIDGRFEDWETIAPALVDPADAPRAFVDIGAVSLSHDDRSLHLQLDLGREVTAQGLDGHVEILFDTDGDPATGERRHTMDGVDLTIVLTPPPVQAGSRGMGTALRWAGVPQPASLYEIDLYQAPTHAGRNFELRLRRGAIDGRGTHFAGERLRCAVVARDLQRAVVDDTEVVAYALGPVEPRPARLVDRDPLQRAVATDLRVVNWNVERGQIFSRPAPFVRILQALEPDVLLLQELPEQRSADDLRRWLTEALPPPEGEAWSVIRGGGGGNLRCVIAARRPLLQPSELHTVPIPGARGRTVRVAGAWMEDDAGRTVLLGSVHLKCCGRAGDANDQRRIDETRAIREAQVQAVATRIPDARIVGGDLNLVGTRAPLRNLSAPLKAGGRPMTVLAPYQPGNDSNATWWDDTKAFAPGRLDYLLYTDQRLESLQSFVLDTRHLDATWLTYHGLAAGDTPVASDHLPIVADLRWRPGP